MYHYLFHDEYTCEDFIVGANNPAEAEEIAMAYFESPIFQYELTDYEAECSGLDEY